jgi:transcription elongation factor S-II
MRVITNPPQFRENIQNELNKIIKNPKICKNLEKGILNYSIQNAESKNIVRKWDNTYFVQLYVDRFRSIYINLKNPDLLTQIQTKKIAAHKVSFMTHQEMKPTKWAKLVEEKKIKDENRYAPKVEASTDNFTCWKCKSKKCTYYQLQTRSADEPMTTFVTCLDCGQRWKC